MVAWTGGQGPGDFGAKAGSWFGPVVSLQVSYRFLENLLARIQVWYKELESQCFSIRSRGITKS